MKEIMMKEGVTVRTPWLKTIEAAAYVGLSLSAFIDHAKKLEHGGDSRNRRYHVEILDMWMNNQIPECPFTAERLIKGRRKGNSIGRRLLNAGGDTTITHPHTGRVHGSRRTGTDIMPIQG